MLHGGGRVPDFAPAGVREPPVADADGRRDLVAAVHVADPGGTVLVVPKPNGTVGHPVQGQVDPQPDAERTSGYDVVSIYQEAAASDEQMAETLRYVLAAREREIRKLIDVLAPRLRPDLTVDSALDLTLALTLPEIYHLLVVERGWDHLLYETWLGDTLVSQLLRD
ncbi:hypothetical protein D0Z08_23145 [Nocardioides immobilis]|uniref:Uncharacterized protein n=1 Tax=Nocardioides immobilis TaxID=2049295 RepID=A0A417XW91_9ACTN|nr:hypothetical protein D0Z08_23145 [Nocardioides immobilis]